jgi:rod shape-determining protein MreC
VRNVISVPLQPIISSGFIVGDRVRDVWELAFNIGSLHDENQFLQKHVQELEAQNALLQDVQSENEQLRTLLEMVPREKYDLIGAEVILRDSVGGNQWVLIDKGRTDGVREEMAVIINDSMYVGRITDADEHTAHVQLLTHPDHVITVTGLQSGAEAIMRGNHGLSAVVEDIKKDVRVENGEKFITSQIGNNALRGLLVGTIHNISISQDGLFQTGNIVPAAELDTLHVVFIVKEQSS